jgi:hypothetical protein
MTEQIDQQQVALPPVKLAIVIDNKVVDIMHTDTRFAAILLSNPVVVDVTPGNEEDQLKTYVGDDYDPESGLFEYESSKNI